MMADEVIVIGAGGHSKVVISTLLELDFNIIGILDDDEKKLGTKFCGVPILGTIELITKGNFPNAILAIGDNKIRKNIYERYSTFSSWISVVHPHSYVHSSVSIGKGTVIFAGAIIQPDVLIGEHVIINTGVSIDHDCKIGDYVHLAPGVKLAGGVSIGEGSFLGINSAVIPGKKIGRWSIVGAGGIVVKDVNDSTTVIGIPAKPMNSK
jgi:sugar O-acyltransferase (sialic acid O-acetyltransferase NeuD family)